MQALQLLNYGPIESSLIFNDVAKPEVKAQDLLIEIKAAAINPIDKGLILGDFQGMLPLQLPSTMAYDVSGIVVQVGAEVKEFAIGDLVYSRVPQEQMGTLAEYVAVNAAAVSKKPGNISFEEAASIPLAGLTALQSLEYAGIKAGDKVLIHAGSGGVGSLAIQYAKAKGAYVYTTTSTTNVEWVKALGADRVIDYKNEDYKTIVREADIVLDTLANEYTTDAFQVIKNGGKVISVIGPFDEDTAKMFGMNDYTLPNEIAQLVTIKEATYKFIFMHPNGDHLAQLKLLIEDEKIKPVIDKVYPFIESIDAFKHLATGRAKGKIVIKIS